MARRLQGFFLKMMYKNSLTVRQRSRKNTRKLMSNCSFRLSEEYAEENIRKLNRVRSRITDMLV